MIKHCNKEPRLRPRANPLSNSYGFLDSCDKTGQTCDTVHQLGSYFCCLKVVTLSNVVACLMPSNSCHFCLVFGTAAKAAQKV